MAHLMSKPVRWLAPVALIGAVGLAACGDSSDSDVSARTVAPSAAVVGSDVHLQNQAAELAEQAQSVSGSDVHLQNLAAELADQAPAISGTDVYLQNQAAELAEQQAHTDGNAVTSARAAEDDTSDDEFVPGTRHMPVR
jgi:hypothetical protein